MAPFLHLPHPRRGQGGEPGQGSRACLFGGGDPRPLLLCLGSQPGLLDSPLRPACWLPGLLAPAPTGLQLPQPHLHTGRLAKHVFVSVTRHGQPQRMVPNVQLVKEGSPASCQTRKGPKALNRSLPPTRHPPVPAHAGTRTHKHSRSNLKPTHAHTQTAPGPQPLPCLHTCACLGESLVSCTSGAGCGHPHGEGRLAEHSRSLHRAWGCGGRPPLLPRSAGARSPSDSGLLCRDGAVG